VSEGWFTKRDDALDDPRPHYAVKVVDFPPRSITCRCGDVFSGDDPVAQIKDHMQEANP